MPAEKAQQVLQQIASAAVGLASMAGKAAVDVEMLVGGEAVEETDWRPPPRVQLTAEEIEMVELGGALP